MGLLIICSTILIFEETPYCFPWSFPHLHFHQQCTKILFFFTSFPRLVISCDFFFLKITILTGLKYYLLVLLICISSIIVILSIFSCTVGYVSLEECLVTSFPPFKCLFFSFFFFLAIKLRIPISLIFWI